MKLFNGRILFALLFVVVFAILIWTAMGYNPKARTFPLLVSIPVFLGAFANLVSETRATLRGEKIAKGETSSAVAGAAHAVAAAQEKAKAAPALQSLAQPAMAGVATAGGVAVAPLQGMTGSVPVPTVPAEVPVAKPEKKKKEKVSGAEKRKRELTGIAWLIGYVVAIILIGFPLATIGYMLAFIGIYSRENWKLTVAYTVILFAFIWIAFVVLLKSNLYSGMIFDALGW